MPQKPVENFFEHRKRSVKARRQDRLFLIALIVILFVMLSGAGGFMLVNWLGQAGGGDLGDIKRWTIWQTVGLVEPPVEPPSLPIPLADVPTYPQEWTRRITRPPQSVCAIIKNIGFKTGGWQRSRGGWDGWECLAEMEIAAGGDIKASAFLSMHGREEDEINNLRLKFNLPPEHQGRKAYANLLANASLIPLFDFFHWTFPDDIKQKILDLSPFETVMDGVNVRLFEEFQSNQRVNLLMWMPEDKFPYEVKDGQVVMHFVKFKKEPARKVTHLRTANETQSTTIDWQPLEQDEEGALLPEEIDVSAQSLVKPAEGYQEEIKPVEETGDAQDGEGTDEPKESAAENQPEERPEAPVGATLPVLPMPRQTQEAVADGEQSIEGDYVADSPGALSVTSENVQERGKRAPIPAPLSKPTPAEPEKAMVAPSVKPVDDTLSEGEARLPVPLSSDKNLRNLPPELLAAKPGHPADVAASKFEYDQTGKKVYSRFNATNGAKKPRVVRLFRLPDDLLPSVSDFQVRSLRRREDLFRGNEF